MAGIVQLCSSIQHSACTQKCIEVRDHVLPLFSLFCSVLADANFPSASIARHGPELVRADGKCCVLAVVWSQWLPATSWPAGCTSQDMAFLPSWRQSLN